ncbi:MAG TPA: gamma-glutamyl-gamma-aminobutyrate hydrolase family protein [Oculatellaceae cyanobacterium]
MFSLCKRVGVSVAAATILLGTGIGAASADSQSHDKPLIGINVDLAESKRKEASIPCYYYEAIEKSGGIPVLIPPMPEQDMRSVLGKLNGLLLIGGDDYPPSMYGEKPDPKTSVMNQERSDFDLALIKEALHESKLPILGICAGCQILNIGSGGSLVQDIPSHHPESKIVHGGPYSAQEGPHMHKVTFEKSTRLSKIYEPASLTVPTSHHQCVGKVGKDLNVAAKTDDGLPEAVERTGERFVVGVQWHPERDFEHNKALFAEFIKQATETTATVSASPKFHD